MSAHRVTLTYGMVAKDGTEHDESLFDNPFYALECVDPATCPTIDDGTPGCWFVHMLEEAGNEAFTAFGSFAVDAELSMERDGGEDIAHIRFGAS